MANARWLAQYNVQEEKQEVIRPKVNMAVPSQTVLDRRWRLRDEIEHDTRDNRRIIPHGGIAHTSRNIVAVLADRERHGPRAVLWHHNQREKVLDTRGDKSPATVFDSPNSTTSPVFGSPRTDDEADRCVRRKRIVYPSSIEHEVQNFAEYSSTIRTRSTFFEHLGGDDILDADGNRPDSSRAVSTISIAFSPDSQTMASTHGDHSVKITSCNTGKIIQTLDGHPRTPWTVKYHPTNSDIIASGCLGQQVRVWNWRQKKGLQMVRLDYAIISVSFHPSGKLLAVANGTRLHFWELNGVEEQGTTEDNDNRDPLLVELDQRHMLRCVHFPPGGNTLIMGGVNPSNDEPRRRRGAAGNGLSFYLRLWDFDLTMALTRNAASLGHRAISNPRTFVPRALLYNDGGFDISPDGKTLCVCAEYWLPDGLSSAVDILDQVDTNTDADQDIEEAGGTSNESIPPQSAVSAALQRLQGLTNSNPVGNSQQEDMADPSQDTGPSRFGAAGATEARSPSFRDDMATQFRVAGTPRRSQEAPEASPAIDFAPRTPPIPREQPVRLSPPSPPGRRFIAGNVPLGRRDVIYTPTSGSGSRGLSTPPPPPPPPPPSAPGTSRAPSALSVVAASYDNAQEAIKSGSGRYVPHVVSVSLDTSAVPKEFDVAQGKHPGAIARGYRPRLGQLITAAPLNRSKASAVTCVKFSPSTDFCLLGYGVRDTEGNAQYHPVTALYRLRGGMTHISTMLSEIDDVNIARFHPDSGYGFVYGTKQGRVRVWSPRPWNYYNC